jgi:hypothetical protein
MHFLIPDGDISLGAKRASALPVLDSSVEDPVEREFERHRCQALDAALGRRSYARAWLPDGTDGELPAQLARACARLWVTPASHEAGTRIGLRCAHLPNVAVDVSRVAPDADASFDLVVVSRFDALRSPAALIGAACALLRVLAPLGELVAVHALARRRHQALHGDAVHQLLLEHLPLEWIGGSRDEDFRVDRWIRR